VVGVPEKLQLDARLNPVGSAEVVEQVTGAVPFAVCTVVEGYATPVVSAGSESVVIVNAGGEVPAGG
jgi:hypothetical protein